MMREDHQASRLLGVNTVSALFRDDPALTAPMDRATTADGDVITIIPSQRTRSVGCRIR